MFTTTNSNVTDLKTVAFRGAKIIPLVNLLGKAVLVFLIIQPCEVRGLSFGRSFGVSGEAPNKQQEIEDQLKLVDVRIVEPIKDDAFPKIELIVRNPGKVAVLKKAIFHVEHVWVLQSTWMYQSMPVTWNYTVELSIYGAPYSQEFDIAQEVPGNGTDRFTFTVGNDGNEPMNRYIFLLRLDLVYNEDNKVLSTPKLLFLAPPPEVALGMTGGEIYGRMMDFIHNCRVVKEIGDFKGTISPSMTRVMKAFAKDFALDIVPELVKNLNNAKEDDALLYYITYLREIGYPSQVALADLQRIASNSQSVKIRAAASDAVQVIKAAKEKPEPLFIEQPKPLMIDGLRINRKPKIKVEQKRVSQP